MRGHLQCRDTLAGNEGCPLKTGTTVPSSFHSQRLNSVDTSRYQAFGHPFQVLAGTRMIWAIPAETAGNGKDNV